MADISLLTQRLDELVELATTASSGFEKAAVYGAAKALEREFEVARDAGKINFYYWEKTYDAVFHLCAAIGYEEDNGHSASKHHSWARGAIMSLETAP